MNQKEKRAALRYLLAEKVKSGAVLLLEDEAFDVPRTKKLSTFFRSVSLEGVRTLVLGEGILDRERGNFVKSLRNIPKKEYGRVSQLNGYSLAKCRTLVVLSSGLSTFLSMLGVA
jgi:large subunit ribosomal protein L4